MGTTKKRVPELRFEGFHGEWEERRFEEDIISIQIGTNLLGSTSNSGIPLIKMGNIQRGYYFLDKLEYLNKNVILCEENFLKNGDFLFNTRNTLELVGKGATWFGKDDIYAFNSNLARFVFRNVNTYFFNFLYNSAELIKQVRARAVGTTSVAAVYPRDLNSLKYLIPSWNEQTLIGNFFKKLDEVIQLLEEELSKYKNLKKAYLAKMFPKEGEKVPELCFPGFSGEWEEKKLGNMAQICTGKLDANAMVENGEYDFYTSGIQKYSIDVPAFCGPAITIAGNGATVGYMHLADGKFNAYQRTYVLNDFSVDRQFLFYSIKMKLPKKIQGEARTGNIPYIVMDMLTDLLLDIPETLDECVLIGNFVKEMDETIELKAKELEKYKDLKKAYLAKMFV